VSPTLEAVLPFWLDRPDDEALEIALEARNAGLGALWIGELATYDAIALATAVGQRAPGLRLKIGPMAVGVRSPASMALGAASVAALTGCGVDVALGASSPTIVSDWHDREWAHSAARMRETIGCLRAILAGDRSDCDGRHVRSHGFRLRRPQPDTRICVAAFGPAMTRVAAQYADELVLNLVPPERVRVVRATVEAEAAAAGRVAPRVAVWVPVALEPGAEARAQLAAQLAIYLAPPGYGEMFSALGFSELVDRARSGARRSELAQSIPHELLEHVCAVGAQEEVAERISAYHDAGADVVGIVPCTAEDPRGRRVLTALTESFSRPRTEELAP
jgi:probable F420-dependent oxidoreductase